MEGEECLPAVQRKFDFYEIEWKIEKFCLASLSGKLKFQSPEINVRGYHSTKWFIILQCESYVSKCFTLTLKRSYADAGPEIMWVDWRTTIFSENWKPDSSDRFSRFNKGSECNEEFKSNRTILDLFGSFHPDCLTVRYKLLFISEDSSLGFQMCQNPGLRDLSENVRRLFHTKKHGDLKLKIKDNIILVHKVIVYSRIEKLNMLLEEEHGKPVNGTCGEVDILDLSHLNFYGMIKIMEYVYSGDLKPVLSKPSLEIYDCVRLLDISELKSYYTPKELFLNTSVNTHEFIFKWLIPDITTLMSNEIEISPVLTDDYFGTKWQLRMSRKEDDCENDYFAIRAEVLGEIKQLCAYLEFTMSDKNNVHSIQTQRRYSAGNLQKFEFENIFSRDAAKSLSDNNSLSVVVRIQLSSGLTNSFTEKQIVPILNCVSQEKCYYLLSANMQFEFETGFFSDFHLNVNGIIYKIHKCIVAARSKRMYDLMHQVESEDYKNLAEIEPSTFRLLLKFLYTGLLTETDCDADYVKLYKIAADFNLPVLKEFCSIYLSVCRE